MKQKQLKMIFLFVLFCCVCFFVGYFFSRETKVQTAEIDNPESFFFGPANSVGFDVKNVQTPFVFFVELKGSGVRCISGA